MQKRDAIMSSIKTMDFFLKARISIRAQYPPPFNHIVEKRERVSEGVKVRAYKDIIDLLLKIPHNS